MDGVIDRSVLDGLAEAIGADGVREIAALARTEIPGHVSGIAASASAGELPTLERSAHTLRSVAGTVGAAALADLAGAVEASARAGDLPPVATLERMAGLATSAVAALAGYLDPSSD